MDGTKRKAMIKAQAAKKKETGNVDPKGMGLSNQIGRASCRERV